jgi:4-amino-4-deoxy-L-arabinose transferase-like glycosyltransferase
MEATGGLKIAEKYYPFILLAIGLGFLVPFLGNAPLFDWDEINFAESAREMLVTGNYAQVQVNFKPFWEKPPLFFWMQAASMKVFGVNEFAARFPNAMIGTLTILCLYFIGKKMKDATFGLVWSLSYLSMVFAFLYFKSGVIDPTFNLFIFLSIYFTTKSIYPALQKNTIWFALLAGTMAGMATLTKGPVALLMVILSVFVFWIFKRFKKITTFKHLVVFGLAYALFTSMWFGLELIANGPWFLTEFIKYQIELFSQPVAGHEQPFYYHFAVVFLGCFPVSVFALPILFRRNREEEQDDFLLWTKILFWVVMIVFTIVKTKILHYSSLSYFPLSFMGALYVYNLLKGKRIANGITTTLLVVGSVWGLALSISTLIPFVKDKITPYINDPFAVACLNTNVKWSGFEFLIGIGWLIGIFISVRTLRLGNTWRGFAIMVSTIILCLLIFLGSIVSKIAQYTQGPPIKFLQQIAGKNVYIKPAMYHSYAPFFYAERTPTMPYSDDLEFLMTGAIEWPVYLLAKSTSRDFFIKYPEVKLIKEEGGFLFYERLPNKEMK